MMAIRFRFRKTNLSFFSILDVFLPHDKIMNMFSLIFDIQMIDNCFYLVFGRSRVHKHSVGYFR